VLDVIGVAVEDRATRLGVLRAVDKLDRLGVAGVRLLLGAGRKDESGDFTKGAGLAPEAAERVIQFVEAGRASRSATLAALAPIVGESAEGHAGLRELSDIVAVLDALGVGEDQAAIDPNIVRGLEYYTGAVFEAHLLGAGEGAADVSFGSVGGGGRYDDLVSRFRGEPIPATGFSVGVSRLSAALAAQRGEAAESRLIVVLPFDANAISTCFSIASELRGAVGAPAEVYLGGSGPRAQLRYADRRQARVAIIVGGDELAAGTVTLKDLKQGAEVAARTSDRNAYVKGQENVQVTLPRADMTAAVRRMLDENGE
jgi:histidyl-tRNA synthetase